MNRNQKIALGCGGGGCLGLIVLVIAVAALIFTGVIPAPGIYNPNRNDNSNYNYNSNRNANDNSNGDSRDNTNDNLNSNSDSSSSVMSDDDKHKLYQAAGMTGDTSLILRVLRKIGLGDGSGNDHQEFIKAHAPWALENLAFIQSINTPAKARVYLDAHIDD